MNELWEEFSGEPVPHLAASLGDHVSLSSSRIADAERAALDLPPKQFEAGWDAWCEAVEPDVAEPVVALVEDPSRLVEALDACGTTFLHGDWRDEQMGTGVETRPGRP